MSSNPNSEIEGLIFLAGNYSDDFDEQEKIEIQLDDITKTALKELVDVLISEREPEDLQNNIYQIAKSNDVQPREFFRILYQIILNTNRGPKIGPFILDIGRQKVGQTIQNYI